MRADYAWGRNGKMDHWYSQEWDRTKQAWSDDHAGRVQFSYDAAARCLGNTNTTRINKHWLNSLRSIITYDAQGYKTAQTVQVWDYKGKAWMDIGREDYTNRSDGAISYHTALRWSRSGGEPLSRQMVRYTYF